MSAPAQGLQAGIASLHARWLALAPRERLMLGAAALLLCLAALWWLAVQPAWRTLRSAPAEHARLEQQWQTMQRQAAEVRALRAAPPMTPALATQALQAAASRLGSGAKLSLQGDKAVLTLTGVDGDALVQFLAEVRRGARARAVQAQLTQSGDGYQGSLVLALGGRS